MVLHNCNYLQAPGGGARDDEDAPLWDVLILDEAGAFFYKLASACGQHDRLQFDYLDESHYTPGLWVHLYSCARFC